MNPAIEWKHVVQSAAIGAILLVAGTGRSLGGSGKTPSDLRRDALSEKAFETILPVLKELKPNDSLHPIEAQMHAYRDPSDTGSLPMVVIPGWISSLSGGAVGGLALLGDVTGRSGDKLLGTHVFGYVRGKAIVVPCFLVCTEATLIDKPEYSRLKAEKSKGTGFAVEPGSLAKLYFRDLLVRETRALSSGDGTKDSSVKLKHDNSTEAREWYFSEASFREIEDKVRSLAPGTNFWDVIATLGGMVTTGDFGASHTLQIRGYIASSKFPTQFLTNDTGVYSIWLFGYEKEKQEVPQLVLVFKNNQLLRVRPFSGQWSVSEYIAEQQSATRNPGIVTPHPEARFWRGRG